LHLLVALPNTHATHAHLHSEVVLDALHRQVLPHCLELVVVVQVFVRLGLNHAQQPRQRSSQHGLRAHLLRCGGPREPQVPLLKRLACPHNEASVITRTVILPAVCSPLQICGVAAKAHTARGLLGAVRSRQVLPLLLLLAAPAAPAPPPALLLRLPLLAAPPAALLQVHPLLLFA
jgi:hypothetical protein